MFNVVPFTIFNFGNDDLKVTALVGQAKILTTVNKSLIDKLKILRSAFQ